MYYVFKTIFINEILFIVIIVCVVVNKSMKERYKLDTTNTLNSHIFKKYDHIA
jgi:hypothetical protein